MQKNGISYFFSGGHIDFKSLCIAEGIFRFLQDMWFVFAVFLLILGDQELGDNFPGKNKAIQLIKKLTKNSKSNNIITTSFNQNPIDDVILENWNSVVNKICCLGVFEGSAAHDERAG